METNRTQAQKRKTSPPSDGEDLEHTLIDTNGKNYPSGSASGATPKQQRQSSFCTLASKDKTPMTPRPPHTTAQSHIDQFVVRPT